MKKTAALAVAVIVLIILLVFVYIRVGTTVATEGVEKTEQMRDHVEQAEQGVRDLNKRTEETEKALDQATE